MKDKQRGSYTIAGLVILALWAAFITGWLINLVEVIQLAVAASPVTTLFIVKAVGIVVAPLGAICGLFF